MRRSFSTALKQSEWDFSTVRDEELHICAWWEYLKEIDEAVRAVEAHRFILHQNKQPTRKQWENSGFTESDLSRHACLPFSFAQDAEWPTVPWNELPKQRRHQIVARCFERDIENVSLEIRGDLLRTGEYVAVTEREAYIGEWVPGRRIKSEGPDEQPLNVEYVLLRIDWLMATENLVHRFRNWITKRRPADAQPEESRGSASNARRLRTLLKQLGVLRLLREMPWTDAAGYTQEFLDEPIMSDYQHTWLRALNSAKKKIECLRTRLIVELWSPMDDYLMRTEMLRK
jgi:hypothetical protein